MSKRNKTKKKVKNRTRCIDIMNKAVEKRTGSIS